jgi:hypothetical protein
MPTLSSFEFFVGHPPRSIGPASPQWAAPLFSGRRAAAPTDPASTVTYGDYFMAVGDYLSKDRMAVLKSAAGREMGQTVTLDRSVPIRIHLVKHGAFYHPSLVTLKISRIDVPLVLNVAVSPQGRKQLPVEVESLRALRRILTENLVPRVYASGSGCASDHTPFPMFIGQWFSDFHEVHLTGADSTRRQQWLVWDEQQGPWHLDSAQVADFYHQAVYILTCSFDPHTLCAVLDWHHAAGDFIVKRCASGLAVRLITVRRYAPFFRQEAGEAVDLELLLNGLAVFLMHTSLWMRFDRLDGTGRMVWADDRTVAPMWEGFVQGVRTMARCNGFPEAFVEGVVLFFSAHSSEDWLVKASEIVARYPAELSEIALMQRHLHRHVERLAAVIRAGG